MTMTKKKPVDRHSIRICVSSVEGPRFAAQLEQLREDTSCRSLSELFRLLVLHLGDTPADVEKVARWVKTRKRVEA